MLKQLSSKKADLFRINSYKNSQIRCFYFNNKNHQRTFTADAKKSLTKNESNYLKRDSSLFPSQNENKKEPLPLKEVNRLFFNECIEQATGRLIKASFSHCGEEDKQLFPNANCLITLSIGQQVHSGAYMAATLESVNSSFKSCTFVLGDTLQRLTLALSSPDDEKTLRLITKEQGEKWLRDTSPLLSKLTIPWKVTRWDYWLEHKKFKKVLSSIEDQYLSESKFKKAFDDNIDAYLERLKKRNALKVDEDTARKLCLRYLQEESAAMWLWVDEGCQYELYASGRAPAMQATYERFIEPGHPDLLRPISMRFKKVINYEYPTVEKENSETNMLKKC